MDLVIIFGVLSSGIRKGFLGKPAFKTIVPDTDSIAANVQIKSHRAHRVRRIVRPKN